MVKHTLRKFDRASNGIQYIFKGNILFKYLRHSDNDTRYLQTVYLWEFSIELNIFRMTFSECTVKMQFHMTKIDIELHFTGIELLY